MPEIVSSEDIARSISSRMHSSTGAAALPATEFFQKELSQVMSGFSYSPVLPIFAVYNAGYGEISTIMKLRSGSKNFAGEMTFCVAPIYVESKGTFEFMLFANESFLGSADKRIQKAVDKTKQQTLTFQEYVDELTNVYSATLDRSKAKQKAYIEAVSFLRFVCMHETLHIVLAHHSRTEKLLKNFGMSTNLTTSEINNMPEKDQALLEYLHKTANEVQDAFINEGLLQLADDSTRLLANKVFKSFWSKSSATAGDESETLETLGHLFRFDIDKTVFGGFFKEQLAKLVKEKTANYPDLSKTAEIIIDKINKGKLLEDLIEEDVLSVIWSAAFRDVENNICPECKTPESEHSRSQQQSNQSQQSKQSEEAQGQAQDGASSAGKDPGSGNEQSDSGKDGQQPGKAPGGCSKCGFGSKGQTFEVTVGKASDGSDINAKISVDGNGKITKLSASIPEGASKEEISQKLQDFEAAVGRQLFELEKSAREELSDEEREKARGFGSVFGRSLDKVIEKDFPWDEILTKFISQFYSEADKQSWCKPVQALRRVGWYYPDEDKASNPNGHSVLFTLDASGSMSNAELSKALGGILSGAKSGIKQMYIVVHDSDVADLSKSKVLANLPKGLNVDKKVLDTYGVLKFDMNEARQNRKKLSELLCKLAKDLPQGGTSHVTPFKTLVSKKFFDKELSKSKLSGMILYTDCESDLENLPAVLEKPMQKIGIKSFDPVVVVDSRKSGGYSHPNWPVISVNGHVNDPKAVKQSKNSKKTTSAAL